jgi:hypothetical protein
MDLRTVLWLIVFVAAIVSRPLDVWLWRKGKISDKTAAVLLLARLPVVVFLALLIGGASLLLAAAVILPLILIERLLYPFMRTVMEDVHRDRETKSPPAN